MDLPFLGVENSSLTLLNATTAFTATANGDYSSIQWDFGDETQSLTTELLTTTHIYRTTGLYTTTITLLDPNEIPIIRTTSPVSIVSGTQVTNIYLPLIQR
jgi:hypothetical protein